MSIIPSPSVLPRPNGSDQHCERYPHQRVRRCVASAANHVGAQNAHRFCCNGSVRQNPTDTVGRRSLPGHSHATPMVRAVARDISHGTIPIRPRVHASSAQLPHCAVQLRPNAAGHCPAADATSAVNADNGAGTEIAQMVYGQRHSQLLRHAARRVARSRHLEVSTVHTLYNFFINRLPSPSQQSPTVVRIA